MAGTWNEAEPRVESLADRRNRHVLGEVSGLVAAAATEGEVIAAGALGRGAERVAPKAQRTTIAEELRVAELEIDTPSERPRVAVGITGSHYHPDRRLVADVAGDARDANRAPVLVTVLVECSAE